MKRILRIDLIDIDIERAFCRTSSQGPICEIILYFEHANGKAGPG